MRQGSFKKYSNFLYIKWYYKISSTCRLFNYIFCMLICIYFSQMEKFKELDQSLNKSANKCKFEKNIQKKHEIWVKLLLLDMDSILILFGWHEIHPLPQNRTFIYCIFIFFTIFGYNSLPFFTKVPPSSCGRRSSPTCRRRRRGASMCRASALVSGAKVFWTEMDSMDDKGTVSNTGIHKISWNHPVMII